MAAECALCAALQGDMLYHRSRDAKFTAFDRLRNPAPRVDSHCCCLQVQSLVWQTPAVVISSASFAKLLRRRIMHLRLLRSAVLVSLGLAGGGLFMAAWQHSTASAQRENAAAPSNPQADLERLKAITPPMSHPMVEVDTTRRTCGLRSRKRIGRWPITIGVKRETACAGKWHSTLDLKEPMATRWI